LWAPASLHGIGGNDPQATPTGAATMTF